MAVIPFVRQAMNIEGDVYKATPIAEGDSTGVLTLNEAENDVTVHIYGTYGGTTFTVQGTLAGVQFNTLDDAYGTALSFTSGNPVKPVGPAVNAIKGVSTGGSGTAMTMDVYITRKVRP